MSEYQLLPFRFERFNQDEYLLTNEAGEFIFLKNDDFQKLADGRLDPQSDLFFDLASKQM